jgi:hypothetical protein
MITGFNTDVEYEGRVFHVQTEDKGRDNPVVESLVYSGGEIVASRRASYAELAQSQGYSEAEVQKRMESQHQALIRDIRNGRFDPEGPKPFGSDIVSNRSLDEVVLDVLARDLSVERIRLEVAPGSPLREGTAPSVRFRVLAETSGQPLARALVAVKVISTIDRAKDLFQGETNPEGFVDAVLELPLIPDGNSALLCQAQLGDSSAEVQHLVQKHGISAEP